MSRITQIADQVVEQLNASEILGEVLAERGYDINVKLDRLTGLRVIVMPGGDPTVKTHEPIGRKKWSRHVKIGVAVQARVASAEPDEVDPYTDLMDAIELFMLGRLIDDESPTQCVGVEHKFPWVPEHLEQSRVFTGVLIFEFSTGL